jgi:hypothetical protein
MLLRILQSLHGHLGVLAAVALLHPAILLRQGKPLTRRNRWALALSSLSVVVTFAIGIVLYGPYRERVRQSLFVESARAGLAFETKEHLALYVVCLSLGGLVGALFAPKEAVRLRRAAALLFALAAGLCLLTAVLGTYVQSVRAF